MPYRLSSITTPASRIVNIAEEISPLEEEDEGSSWIKSLRTLLRSLS